MIDPRTLTPLDDAPIHEDVSRTGRALLVQEAPGHVGFTAELAARIAESPTVYRLLAPVRRLSGLDVPIPYAPQLEKASVPQVDDIVEARQDDDEGVVMARLAIRMPKMSMTMTEGEVSEWMVRPGDEVAEGDVVCEVMTDKVDMEVESTVSGTLVEIVVESGTVAVGEPDRLGRGRGHRWRLRRPAERAAARRRRRARALGGDRVAEPEPSRPRVASPGPVAAVPRARALARERGVDLSTITGTGPDGLVRVEDVGEPRAHRALHRSPHARPDRRPARHDPRPGTGQGPERQDPGRGRAEDDRERRRAPVHRLARRPPRPSRTAGATGSRGRPCSCRRTPRRCATSPSCWTAGTLTTSTAVSSGPPAVALAVATAGGLMVPVFAEPDVRDPHELDAEVKAVVAAAHLGRLDPSYLGVANGSLSNLGGLGVDRFQALVTPPQASVLALGAIARRPVAVRGRGTGPDAARRADGRPPGRGRCARRRPARGLRHPAQRLLGP